MSALVHFTREAVQQTRAIDDWWRQNRTAAPQLFVEELAAVVEILRAAPLAGRRYFHPQVPGVRRILLRATRTHLYYVLLGEDVFVLAVWGAVRGRGPDLSMPDSPTGPSAG